MAVQFINDPYRNPGLAALRDLGTGLGSGISSGLNLLAQNKFQQLAQRQQQNQLAGALEGLVGDKQLAQTLSLLPQDLLKIALQNPALLQQFSSQSPMVMQEPHLEQSEQQSPDAQPLSTSEAAALPQQQVQPKNNLVADLFTSPQEKREREKLEIAKRKLAHQEKADAFKETKEFRKDIYEKAKSARQNLHDLERMEELEKEGKLDTPGYVEFLKRSGLDIPALMNPGSEEFNKIAANFLRDAKTFLGASISNFELEQFLKTIPSLSQSPEGRKRVISNLKYFNRAGLEYNDALKEAVKENRGIPPLDLMEQVDEKITKRLDKIAKKFKEDLEKPVPQGQNKAVTAVQTLAGDLIGKAPGAIKSAGKGALQGALYGRYFGGPAGVATGGVLGGLGGLLGLL